MDGSAAELRALLGIVGGALVAVVVAVAMLLRSGRAVQLPDLAATDRPSRTGREDHPEGTARSTRLGPDAPR